MTVTMFAQVSLLQYKALFSWASPSAYVATKLLAPVFQLALFIEVGVYLSGHADPSYFAIGNAVQLVAINGIHGVVQVIGKERINGTLPYVLGSPAKRPILLASKLLVQMVDGMATATVGLLVSVVLFGVRVHGFPGLLILSIVVAAVSTVGLGVALGGVSLMTRDTIAISNAFQLLLLLVAGSTVPIARLPNWLQAVSLCLPLRRSIEAARLSIAGGPTGEVAKLLASDCAVAGAYLALGVIVFSFVAHRGRRAGMYLE